MSTITQKEFDDLDQMNRETDEISAKLPKIEDLPIVPPFASPPFRVELEVEDKGRRVRVCVEGDDLGHARDHAIDCLRTLNEERQTLPSTEKTPTEWKYLK